METVECKDMFNKQSGCDLPRRILSQISMLFTSLRAEGGLLSNRKEKLIYIGFIIFKIRQD